MYGAAAYYLPNHLERWHGLFPSLPPVPLLPLLGVCAFALRLYLLAAVGFDYPDTGRLFRPLFPVILLLDAAWALSPFLLFKELGSLTLFCAVGLAFLPFCQRTLVYSAYAPRGGRISGIRAAGSF
jgi:hypothetical protein